VTHRASDSEAASSALRGQLRGLFSPAWPWEVALLELMAQEPAWLIAAPGSSSRPRTPFLDVSVARIRLQLWCAGGAHAPGIGVDVVRPVFGSPDLP